MHPPDSDCPAWEYADHPKREVILKERTEDILVQLYQQQLDFVENAADSRAIHGYLFSLLAPREYLYYAGHYRGENFPCLKNYYAGIQVDSSVGFPPFLIEERMEKIAQWVREGMRALDATHQLPDTQVSPEDKLLNTVTFACAIFAEVLRVHPYANGNGHVARFILWCILGKYDYWPKHFPIEPRPNHPQYFWAIGEYLKGNRQPLEDYILLCIAG
jgi:fido (protein-threonine AMPylation protein)